MLEPIFTPKFKRFGVVHPPKPTEYMAEVVPGVSIRIVADIERYNEIRRFDRTFKIGDIAEYDSYNLSYTGKITRITNNQVWVESYRTYRLNLYTFAWRNFNFDEEQTAKSNFLISMSI